MRNPDGRKIIYKNIPKYDEYLKYDELYSKIHYNFRSNLNLPSDLSEKNAKCDICEHLHHIVTFQFN